MDGLQVIASPRRLRILELVWDRELSAGQIAAEFDVSWSAISQHITVLRTAGFVQERREGTSRIYRADQAALGPLRSVVEDHWRGSLARLKAAAEAEQTGEGSSMTEPDVLEVTVHISARPETVFSYFTDPVRYVQWMGSSATLEPTPGGRYRVGMRDGVEAVGEFLEVDPPHRLVFTWGWTDGFAVPPGSTRVVVTLVEEDGGTRVLLRHYGLPDEDQVEHHRGGWGAYLGRLSVRAAGGDPGPDPNAIRE